MVSAEVCSVDLWAAKLTFTNFRPFELVPPTTKEEFQEWVCTQVADREYAEKMMNQALFGTDEAGTSGKLSWACTIYRKTGLKPTKMCSRRMAIGLKVQKKKKSLAEKEVVRKRAEERERKARQKPAESRETNKTKT